jgi:hypothetical protein
MLTTLKRPEAIGLRCSGTVAIHKKRIPKAIAVTPTATPTNRPTQALPRLPIEAVKSFHNLEWCSPG